MLKNIPPKKIIETSNELGKALKMEGYKVSKSLKDSAVS